MIASIKSEDIDATLKHGQIYANKTWRTVIISFYVVLCILFALILLLLIGAILIPGSHGDTIIVIVGVSITSLILLFLNLYFHHLYCSGKKEVNNLLQDAVLLKANTVSKGEKLVISNFMARMAVALEVYFTYENKKYVRQSIYKDKPLYLAVYKKYVNKSITIAYSPKYDEVMLIKSESKIVN